MLKNQEFLSINNLSKYFTISKRKGVYLRAVDDLSLKINRGETLGLVGESGCGKSTTGRMILNLLEASAGEVFFDNVDILRCSKKQMHDKRRKMQMIFQDPFASLNSRMTVGEIIREPLDIYKVGSRQERKEKVTELLEEVGLTGRHAERYPHEFSGGQRQRICIARALALNPDFIVCDEAVSALDVSIQAQIINLLKRLQKDYQLTYLFISHDLSVVEYISDRVAVMYLGKIVELASTAELYKNPRHPYTRALISAIPVPEPKKKKERIILKGDVPNPIEPPVGCRFSSRCPQASELCHSTQPQLREVGANHFVACRLAP